MPLALPPSVEAHRASPTYLRPLAPRTAPAPRACRPIRLRSRPPRPSNVMRPLDNPSPVLSAIGLMGLTVDVSHGDDGALVPTAQDKEIGGTWVVRGDPADAYSFAAELAVQVRVELEG